jgi:hypothetical protein
LSVDILSVDVLSVDVLRWYHVMTISNILQPHGICYGHLIYVVVFWQFFQFWYVVLREISQPWWQSPSWNTDTKRTFLNYYIPTFESYNSCVLISGLPDFSWYNIGTKMKKNIPNHHKVYQMAICKMYQMAVKYVDQTAVK